jgi:predicted secreted protein
MIEEPKFEPKKQDVKNQPLGAPEYNVLRYCAQNTGREVLELGYMRGWEKNKPPLKTFSITVSIRK